MLDVIDLSKIVANYYMKASDYRALPNNKKKDNFLFYLDDGTIYKGLTLYSQSILCVDTLPENPSINRIYIHENKLKQFVDGEWKYIPLVSMNSNECVTEETLLKFTNNIINNYRKSLIFETLEDAIEYSSDEEKSLIGEIITVLYKGKYCAAIIKENRSIGLISSASDGSISIDSTESIELTMDAEDKLSASLKVSQADGNGLIVKEDGVYCGIPINVIL